METTPRRIVVSGRFIRERFDVDRDASAVHTLNDTVAEWVAPSETINHPDYLSELLKLCENAEEAGDLPLALYYAKAALQISGGSPRFSNIVKNLESRIPATHK